MKMNGSLHLHDSQSRCHSSCHDQFNYHRQGALACDKGDHPAYSHRSRRRDYERHGRVRRHEHAQRHHAHSSRGRNDYRIRDLRGSYIS